MPGFRPYFQIDVGVSSTQGIEVGNGNFNTDLNATGPKFDATLSVPIPGGLVPNSTFQARFYGFNGRDSQALSGNAGTFLQANGGVQVINLPISSGETEAEMTQIGGEGLMLFPSSDPLRHFGAIFSPLFGAGFERVTLDTQTSVRISGLNFHTTDSRTTVTDRIFITGGLEADFPITPDGFVLHVFGRGQVNFDHVRGTAINDTAQVGVFAETLHNQFSRNTVTFGGQTGIGVARVFANGGRFEIKTTVASVPVHRLDFNPGQPATLEHSNHLNVTAGASLNIPLTYELDGGGPQFRGTMARRSASPVQ